jgi:hypothetical protein
MHETKVFLPCSCSSAKHLSLLLLLSLAAVVSAAPRQLHRKCSSSSFSIVVELVVVGLNFNPHTQKGVMVS